MSLSPKDCCVLNSGNGAWAFAPLASRLSMSLDIDVSDQPRQFNYLLHLEQNQESMEFNVFIPLESVRLASDKRLLASIFGTHEIPTPRTVLCDTFGEALSVVRENSPSEWCLKYPTSCGANGHRILLETSDEPSNWPRPFIVQEFVKLQRPEVYRTYCAGGELFGWVARRFPEDIHASPWVAHAQGAQYVVLNNPPERALEIAKHAFKATGLWDSFGCVDLLCRPTGEWLVLEVGTDGLFNHVDRDVGNDSFERELDQRIAAAFWKSAEKLFRTETERPSVAA